MSVKSQSVFFRPLICLAVSIVYLPVILSSKPQANSVSTYHHTMSGMAFTKHPGQIELTKQASVVGGALRDTHLHKIKDIISLVTCLSQPYCPTNSGGGYGGCISLFEEKKDTLSN